MYQESLYVISVLVYAAHISSSNSPQTNRILLAQQGSRVLKITTTLKIWNTWENTLRDSNDHTSLATQENSWSMPLKVTFFHLVIRLKITLLQCLASDWNTLPQKPLYQLSAAGSKLGCQYSDLAERGPHEFSLHTPLFLPLDCLYMWLIQVTPFLTIDLWSYSDDIIYLIEKFIWKLCKAKFVDSWHGCFRVIHLQLLKGAPSMGCAGTDRQ